MGELRVMGGVSVELRVMGGVSVELRVMGGDSGELRDMGGVKERNHRLSSQEESWVELVGGG